MSAAKRRPEPVHIEPTQLHAAQGFPGYYATEDGRVFVLKELRPQKKRYAQISMTVLGKTTWTHVHRIVCRAFHGERPSDAHEVAHNNGDPYDNRASNLRWATREENAADRGLHGTAYRGDGHRWAQVTEEDVRSIRARVAAGERQCDLADEYHMHRSGISHIVSKRTWKHVS